MADGWAMMVTAAEGDGEGIASATPIRGRSVAAQAVARLLLAFRDVKLEDAWPVAHFALIGVRLAQGGVRQWLY